MSQLKQFAQNVGLVALTNFFIGFQAIILLPILTKTLPIEAYGIWIQITVTIGLIPSLVMLGLPYTMVRFLAASTTREEKQEGFYSITFITLITAGTASLIFFIFAEQIASILFEGQILITQLLALLVFVECINLLQYNYFRTFQLMKRYSLLLLVRALLQVILTGGFVLIGFGLMGAVGGYLIANISIMLIMGILIVSGIGFAFPKFKNIRDHIAFGLPTVPSNLSSWVVKASDRYVIGIALGAAFVGYYGPGYSLGNMIAMFIAPLSFILPVVLSKHYDERNIDAVNTILKYSMKYYLMLAIPAVVGLSLLSKPLLEVLSTPEIAAEGFFITPFVALSTLIIGIYSILMQVFILEKKTKVTGTIWIIAAIINFGLNLLLIPYIGIIGAALTTLIANIFALSACFYMSKGEISKVIFSREIIDSGFRCLIISIFMIPVIILLMPKNIVSIVIVIFLCIFLYFVAIIISRVITRDEVEFFRSLLKS